MYEPNVMGFSFMNEMYDYVLNLMEATNPFHFCSQYYEPELGNLKDLLRKPNRFIITIIKIYLSIFRPHCQCFQKTFEVIYGGIIIVGFAVFHRHFGHLRSQYLEDYVFFPSFHLVLILGIWSDR